VSELLEVPALVAASDMLGVFPAAMAARLEELVGLAAVALPMKLAPLPVYLVWHEARRGDAGHRWLRDLAAAELRAP